MSTVEHPDHYGGDVPTEPIKVIRAWGLNFSLGNAVKYITRAGKKDPGKKTEDLSKAIFYIEDEIQRGDRRDRYPLAAITRREVNLILAALADGASQEERSRALEEVRFMDEMIKSEMGFYSS